MLTKSTAAGSLMLSDMLDAALIATTATAETRRLNKNFMVASGTRIMNVSTKMIVVRSNLQPLWRQLSIGERSNESLVHAFRAFKRL